MNSSDRLKIHPRTELFVFDQLTGELEIVKVADVQPVEEWFDPDALEDNPKTKAESSITIDDEVVTLDILPVRC